MALDDNSQLGRYRILSRLGTGGMGEVYRALAVGPDGVEKAVAVKLVREDLLGNGELVKLFVEEAKVSFVLTHPNVLQTYEMGQVDEHFFLVMEYVDGTSLASVLYYCTAKLNQPMPAPFALFVTSQVVRGLDYAHALKDHGGRALGIVHRDVSPSNVLISWDGQVKVADFGLAKSALRKMETQVGGIKGKLAYMAPEQLRGEEVDARADIFSLGVMMYEMLAGQNPYGDLDEITLGRRLSHETIEPLATLAPHLDAEVTAMVDRCLAEQPGDRFAAARDLGHQLDRLMRVQGLISSDYGLAEFIGRIQEMKRTAAPSPHPFDRVLGMELERVAGQQALSTFIAVPSSKPFAEQETLVTEPPPEPAPTGTALLPPQSRSTLRWVALAGVVLLLAVAAFGIAHFRGQQPAGAVAPDAALVARPDTVPPVPAPGPKTKPATTARLHISAPPGAQVMVDGKPRGGSPLTLEALPAGKVRVQITLQGHRPYDQQVALEPGATLILQPELTPLTPLPVPGKKKKVRRRTAPAGHGTLSVNTDPWSVVQVDGVKVGNTPLVGHRLAAGKHTVRMVNPGTKLSKQQVVIIKKDKHHKLSLSLQ